MLGRIASMEINHKAVEKAKKGDNIALKIEKALDLYKEGNPKDDGDEEIALITSAFRKILKGNNKNFNKTNNGNRDLKEVVCYHF